MSELTRNCLSVSSICKPLPGIGWIVASQLMARIGDWRQIKNIRQLPAFLGLVPTESSTGERTERGSITHTGDPRLAQ